jgi:HsdM N-terminal domain
MVSPRKIDDGASSRAPRRRKAAVAQPALPLNGTVGTPASEHLTISQLETWLWDAACAIRGAQDAPKFKDFILPLLFYKRAVSSSGWDTRYLTWSRLYGAVGFSGWVVGVG